MSIRAEIFLYLLILMLVITFARFHRRPITPPRSAPVKVHNAATLKLGAPKDEFEVLYSAGSYEQALRVANLRVALENNSEELKGSALIQQGRALQALNRIDEAVSAFDCARFHTKDPDVLLYLIQVYQAKFDYQQVAYFVRTYLDSGGSVTEWIHVAMTKALFRLNRKGEATDWLRKAQQDFPNSASLALVENDLNQKAISESHAVTAQTDTPQTVTPRTVSPRTETTRAAPPQPSPPQADSARMAFSDVGPALDGLAGRYGIRIVWQERLYTRTISGEKPDPYWLTTYTPILVAELSRYPVDLVQRAHLNTITLCSDLANNNLTMERQLAIGDNPGGALYYCVDFHGFSTKTVRSTFNHEFFHMIDYWMPKQYGSDPEWKKLNPFGFQYGYGGQYMRDKYAAAPDDSLPGFLDRYSTSDDWEDRAQIFAYMMVRPEVIARRAARDPIIQKKIDRLCLVLEQFSPGSTNILWRNSSR